MLNKRLMAKFAHQVLNRLRDLIPRGRQEREARNDREADGAHREEVQHKVVKRNVPLPKVKAKALHHGHTKDA